MRFRPSLLAVCWLAFALPSRAGLTPEQLKALPPAASRPVDFQREIKPIFEASCIKCHGRGRNKGGLQIDSRQTLLRGGDSGPAVIPGKSADSSLIALVAGVDPDEVMPKKGTRLTAEQIGLLRAWIDQGLPWDAGVGFGRIEPLNLKPRLPQIPAGRGEANPVDRFIDDYFATHGIVPPKVVSDRVFARRAYLDIVGLLPPAKELESFAADRHRDKRERLTARLLAQNRHYAEHWLSYWNDLLRNDYKGTGYIDGGRRQITRWLYAALVKNMPYDQFVAQLVNPNDESEGFVKGIVWRGVVNASQTPQMQAAQNISQVFLGVNLKCASCHDSFINDWQLSDSYGLAGIYSDKPLEISQCDKPTGHFATAKFLYPELGEVQWTTNRQQRLEQLANVITGPKDGRLSRTVVNRLWAKFMGHGLVEPVDDMEQPAWDPGLLDWLAEDLAAHHYDLKQTMARIVTSRAYQLPASEGVQSQKEYVFAGPRVRRMTAEEFRDALTSITGVGYVGADAEVGLDEETKAEFKPKAQGRWIWNDPNAAEKAKPGTIYVRKLVHLPERPDEAAAFVMCDNEFVLFVNGTKAGSGSDYRKPSLINLRPFLKAGDNVIAVEAVNFLSDGSAPAPEKAVAGEENPAGLFLCVRARSVGSRGATSPRRPHTERVMDFATDSSASGGRRSTAPPTAEKTMDFATDSSWLVSTRKEEGWPNQISSTNQDWQPASELGPAGVAPWKVAEDLITAQFAKASRQPVRASLVAADPLTTALGRPNHEQVVTTRATEATTLQALELTNGKTLSQILQRGSMNLLKDNPAARALIQQIYQQSLGRPPGPGELKLAEELVGAKPQPKDVEDFLWALVMMPEFQLIY